MIQTVRSSTPHLAAVPAKPMPAESLRGLLEVDGFEPGADRAKLAAATAGGAVAGSVALGLGTKFLSGPSEVLLGMVNGSVTGAALGGVLGAVVASSMGRPDSDGRSSGSIGTALVGGALGTAGGFLSGTLLGAYVGHACGNILGFAAGGVVGGAAAYVLARRRLTAQA